VEEVHRFRVAPVFAAHTDLEAGAGGPPAFGSDLHKLAYAIDIKGLEWADPEDAHLEVGGEECCLDVVAGESQDGLGEVVRAADFFSFGKRPASRPNLFGLAPSTSLSGSMADAARARLTPCTDGSPLSRRNVAAIASPVVAPPRFTMSQSIPTLAAARSP
jgi:hypothetical protein